ncbi:MAG TPA: GPP34 family phosphoprotein [Stellaceae bacterium]|jgi:Golgi phosphoprotein 3|nr:GPP34 family phosphoprotein [Stellaceae bacterium]
MLSFSEEIVLLLLDETNGDFVPLPESVFAIVMSGAALMDLALHNRVDSDLEKLTVVDRTPLGDNILDDVLAGLGRKGAKLAIVDALFDVAANAEEYRSRALARLIARGILKQEKGRHLWVFRTRRYPVIDDSEQQEVRARLRQLLLSDEIPDPRDVVLVCLIDACALVKFVLSADELDVASPRVEQLRKLDLIGQAVTKAASETEAIIKFAATTM